MRYKTREEAVEEFRTACGRTNKYDGTDIDQSIMNTLEEEFLEFLDAVIKYHKIPVEVTREQLVKEWADLQYVLSQAAVYFEIPADEAFYRVHDNNMTKVGPDGKVTLREDGKILKPEGFVPVSMKGL